MTFGLTGLEVNAFPVYECMVESIIWFGRQILFIGMRSFVLFLLS